MTTSSVRLYSVDNVHEGRICLWVDNRLDLVRVYAYFTIGQPSGSSFTNMV